MDGDNSLNIHNWGYYDSTPNHLRSHIGLQLMPSMPEKPLLDTREIGARNAALMSASASGAGPFQYHQRDIGAPQTMYQMNNYMRDPFRMFSGNPNYSMLPETSSAQHMQMVQPPDLIKDERVVKVEEEVVANVNGPSRKRQGPKGGPKSPKPKKPKNGPLKAENSGSVPRARAVKKTTEVMINGINMDISSIPIPVCSCTGGPQQCYRWGSGGWQSACCTTGLSVYPLPMSTKRRGARIAGRKMSLGAFKKVLEKLAAEGYNFANPIDLRTHWAKHGTNKFVTIR